MSYTIHGEFDLSIDFAFDSAVDGDSPKILGFSNAEVCGILSNAEEIEDFDFDTL